MHPHTSGSALSKVQEQRIGSLIYTENIYIMGYAHMEAQGRLHTSGCPGGAEWDDRESSQCFEEKGQSDTLQEMLNLRARLVGTSGD